MSHSREPNVVRGGNSAVKTSEARFANREGVIIEDDFVEVLVVRWWRGSPAPLFAFGAPKPNGGSPGGELDVSFAGSGVKVGVDLLLVKGNVGRGGVW